MDVPTREAFYRGLVLYNRGQYLECQQHLEEAFHDADESDQPLVRAIIALACGMHLHFKHGARRGVENMCRRCLLELEAFEPAHLGVDVAALSKAVTEYLEELRTRKKPGASFFLPEPKKQELPD